MNTSGPFAPGAVARAAPAVPAKTKHASTTHNAPTASEARRGNFGDSVFVW
jgi:hypothetical protein